MCKYTINIDTNTRRQHLNSCPLTTMHERVNFPFIDSGGCVTLCWSVNQKFTDTWLPENINMTPDFWISEKAGRHLRQLCSLFSAIYTDIQQLRLLLHLQNGTEKVATSSPVFPSVWAFCLWLYQICSCQLPTEYFWSSKVKNAPPRI